MDERRAAPDRRTLTPAIVVSALFVAVCAAFAVLFINARGGLELPVYSGAPVAVASDLPGPPPTTGPSHTGSAPTAPALTPAPSEAPTPPPTPEPTASAPPGFVLPTLQPGDPLLALPGCPDRPGCFEYVVVRYDTVSGIISRYLLDIRVLEALNPGRLSDPSLIVVGQVLYLGRDPLARLEPCPDAQPCVLYVVRPGDSVAGIASRYQLTRETVLAANPGLALPIQAGQVIRLPRLAQPR